MYCHKTTTFPTKLAAQLALLRMTDRDRRESRAHYCDYHRGWHLTRSRRGRKASPGRSVP
jgi:hypothetical protein